MKHLRSAALLAGTMAASFSSLFAASLPPRAAAESSIRYEGRYVAEATGAVRLAFPGVTAHLRFQGTALTLRAEASVDDLYFDVSLDGAAPTILRLAKGADEYPVVVNAPAGEHTVQLARRNESWQGTVKLLDFQLAPEGAWLPPPELPSRRLMFIGDSVTAGEMTTWAPAHEMTARINCSGPAAYGMILARRFHAQCHLVAYGGRGIIRDWQGIRDTANAPQFYELALPDEPTLRWDHHRYVPDAIGVGLGTNDFNQGVPDQNEFVNAYVEFIAKLRRDAPDALIFVMDSPIVNDEPGKGPRRTILHSYLEQVVARARSPKVILAPIAHYPGVPGNGHPTGAEHVAMADELEPVLKRALGW